MSGHPAGGGSGPAGPGRRHAGRSQAAADRGRRRPPPARLHLSRLHVLISGEMVNAGGVEVRMGDVLISDRVDVH